MGQIDLFENYSYSIGPPPKKKNYTKKYIKCTYERTMNTMNIYYHITVNYLYESWLIEDLFTKDYY